MSRTPPHHGEEWTDAQIQQLRGLARGNTPTRVIAIKLGRTPDAVRSRAWEEDISLAPWNQSPYNRRRN